MHLEIAVSDYFVPHSSNDIVLQPWGDFLYDSKPLSELERMVVFIVFYSPTHDLEWFLITGTSIYMDT